MHTIDIYDHFDYLINKKITQSGFTVDYSLFESLRKIKIDGHPEIICFSKYKIRKDSIDLFDDLDFIEQAFQSMTVI